MPRKYRRTVAIAVLCVVFSMGLVFTGLPTVRADTFGNTSVSGMSTYLGTGYILFARYTAGAIGGPLSSISLAATGGTGNVAIYSDSSGSPGSLLAQGTTQSLSNGWNTFSTLSAPVAIASSTSYWLAFEMSGASFYYADSGGPGGYGYTSTCCTMPSTIVVSTIFPHRIYGIYATYSTGPPPGDFTVTPTPTSQSVGAGSSASSTLSLAVGTGFSGTVALSVTSGCPTGVTCTLSQSLISSFPGSSTLTVPTLTSTSGTFPVVVTATSGSLSHTATFTVTVSSASTYNFNVRAGATQVVVTVSWTGTGTASVTIAGPGGTPTMSESGAVVYDRITYVSGSSTPTNIHRVTFTLSSPPTGTWIAYVSQSGATVTIEVS